MDTSDNRVKYNPAFVEIARKFFLLFKGATNSQLAELLSVSEGTIQLWVADKPEFREAIHKGKVLADMEVAASAYRNAVGYTTVQKRITKQGELIQTQVEVPGDVRAQMFWLSARHRDQWRISQDPPPQDGGTLAPVGSAEIVEAARRIAFILARAAYQDVTTVEAKEISHDKPPPRKT